MNWMGNWNGFSAGPDYFRLGVPLSIDSTVGRCLKARWDGE